MISRIIKNNYSIFKSKERNIRQMVTFNLDYLKKIS